MENCEFDKMLDEIRNDRDLKRQLKESVWKPIIKTYICRRDREPKRKLFINIESKDLKFAKIKK